MSRVRRLLVVTTAAAMFVTVLSGPVLADKPVFMDRFVDEFTEEDPGFAAACGVATVHVDGVVKGTFKEFADGTFWEQVVGKIEFTGPDDEGPVVLSFANVHEGNLVSESVDNGLLTLVFEDTFIGNPEKWRAPGVGVIVRDAGFISWTVTVVIDLSTDELVSEEFTDVEIHGPHPIFENGFSFTEDQFAQICSALGA